MSTEYLRFAPEILRRLGEELVPHPDLGIVELVRNAYDADATVCTVTLTGTGEPEGTVVIADDGSGMTLEEIRDGWLLLGKSQKADRKFSEGGRRRVGEKGLGRLAALRLGDMVTMDTSEGMLNGGARRYHRVTIDWRIFDRAEAIEDVPLQVTSAITTGTRGTIITIEHLRQRLNPSDVRRLARALVLLTGPFPGQNTFRAVLDAPEYEQMERLVNEAYFAEHEYLLIAQLRDGRVSATLTDWRGRVLAKGDHSRVARRSARGKPEYSGYQAPEATFQLWMFNLSRSGFDMRSSSRAVAAVREWLNVVGGVHLFQRGLRVHPYGDPGYDWLEMNLRRVRSPEARPSTNTAVGRIVVDDDEDLLIPKTDRTGFIENDAFQELRRFGQDVLDWAAEERLRLRDEAHGQSRKRSASRLAKATASVDRAVEKLPTAVRTPIEKAVAGYQKAVIDQLRTAEDDVQLYRTLSTVGTTSAVFAHETLRPVATIEQLVGSLRSRVKSDLPETFGYRYETPFDMVLGSAQSLRTFAELPLRMLQRSKRRPGPVNLNEVISETLMIFEPYLTEAGVVVTKQLSEEPPVVTTTPAAVEAIVSNLISNSAYFFTEHNGNRDILLRTNVYRSTAVISVADSGPGILRLEVDEVWLPGRTTREGGTGLGLTIVRDIVRDLGGTVSAIASGSLGGAEFQIELPRAAELPGDLPDAMLPRGKK